MRRTAFFAVCAFTIAIATAAVAVAAPTSLSITIPLRFGGGHSTELRRAATPAELRAESRLRLARYGLQLADAIVSAIGYHAYARCLSCLAYPGGGPRGALPVTTAQFNGGRPAEVDPLIQPFSGGGFGSLALGTLAYDFIDAKIEKHWPVERRIAADDAEIGAHLWGVSTWLPELRTLAHNEAIASACGSQWRAKHYGEAFTDGCVNAYYRTAPGASTPLTGGGIVEVCAPARFKRGTYLFATGNAYIISDGSPCADVNSPFH